MSGRAHGACLLPGYAQAGFTTPESLGPDPYVPIKTWVSLSCKENRFLSEPVYFKGNDEEKNELLLHNKMEQNTSSKNVADIFPDGLSLRCFSAPVPCGFIRRNLTDLPGSRWYPVCTNYSQKIAPVSARQSGRYSLCLHP